MNSIPLLVFTGQVSTVEFGKGAFQESTGYGQSINTVDFFKPITKESFALINPTKVAETIRYAIRSATSGRMGPVHINVPFDIQLAEIEYQLQEKEKHSSSNELHWESAAMEEALSLIDEAKNPVFLIGWGGVLSGANNEIIEIAEKLKIPVATTIQGKGAIPTNHSLCLGIMGICGHPTASEYIFEESDLLIAVGASFGEFTTFNWDERFLKNKKIIQIDIDNREIGKNYPVQVGLVGDAKVIIHQLKLMIDKSDIKFKKSGDEIENFIKTTGMYINSESMEDNSIPIKPQRVMKEVRDNTPGNTIFLADSGSHCAWAMHYLPIYHGGGFYPAISLGSMGASICSSIGVKLTKPGNPVICICGDGSFLMYGNEIATAEQFNIPVIWVILNDSKYSMPAFSSKKMYDRTIGVKLSKTNFSKLAEAFNVKGYRVERPGELPEILTEAIALNKPVVIDVVIDPDEIPPIGQRK
ncbi:MAG: thiamine pyrophosphate-binding protein, partial [Bacteroidales bacterium]